MSALLTVFAFLCGIAVALAAVLILIVSIVAIAERLYSRLRNRVFDEALQFHRDRLRAEGFWLSEHKPTMDLIHALADGRDTGEARAEWKSQCAAIAKAEGKS